MSDSDSDLLSDSDDEIDYAAQARKAKAAAASTEKAEPAAAEEESKEEEVAEANDAAAEEEEPAAAEEEEVDADAAAKEEEERAEAARIAAEEEARKAEAAAAAEAEEKKRQEEEERKQREAEEARKAEEAAKAAAAEEEKRKEAERKKKEEEERKKLEAEKEAARKAAEAEAEEEDDEEEDEEDEEEEEQEDEEEEVDGAEEDKTVQPRKRTKSTFQDQHHEKMKELADKEARDRMEAEQNMQNFSKGVVHFQSEADKRREEEKAKLIAKREEDLAKVADAKNTIEDGERRLTEFKNARKKSKKKKSWKPLIHGYVNIVNSSFKMKKGKAHKIDRDEGHYLALQQLPQSCNIDETEAEWTKNKKSDTLCPALVAFSSEDKYQEFAKKVGKKNMKEAGGLMLLAKFATGLCHLRDEFAIGSDVASAIATLKTDFIHSDAVLPVDSYRGGDSGEDQQFVIVDRSQAFVLVVDDEEGFTQWQEQLKSVQPHPDFTES